MATKNTYNAEFIERYLNDEVTQEERQNFDEQLIQDPELLEYFTLFMDIDLAIDQPDVMDLRNNLQNVYDSASSEWLEEAPMIVENSFEEEIDSAISELDVMALRSTLNDLHDLHVGELHTTESAPAQVPVPEENVELSVVQDLDFQDVDILGNEIDQAIMEEDVMALRSRLEKIGEEYNPVKKTRSLRHNFRQIASIAAVALIMLTAGTFWISDSQPVNPEKIVSQFFEAMDGRGVQRGGDKDHAISAFEQYRDKDFASASSFFEAYENDGNVLGNEHKTYHGISKLKENKSLEALKLFNEVIEHGDNTYVQDAQWYSVGCRIRNENVGEAISQLRQLALVPEHKYMKEIKKLLKKLE